jgi:hypothetical protein
MSQACTAGAETSALTAATVMREHMSVTAPWECTQGSPRTASACTAARTASAWTAAHTAQYGTAEPVQGTARFQGMARHGKAQTNTAVCVLYTGAMKTSWV